MKDYKSTCIVLHAPDNDTRSRIMRINRRYPIEVVMDAINEYIAKTNVVTFEYIMLGSRMTLWNKATIGPNLQDKKRLSYVNLIPYNKAQNMTNMNGGKERVVAFLSTMFWSCLITRVVRKEFGHDTKQPGGQHVQANETWPALKNKKTNKINRRTTPSI